jgi:membrane protease YdiL (CAAX protease family)
MKRARAAPRPRWHYLIGPFLVVAMLIWVEAVLIAPGHVLAGEIVDAVLLFLLLQIAPGSTGGSVQSDATRSAMRGLALVPLMRVLAIGLPLLDGSQAAGTLVVAVLVGFAALRLAPAGSLTRQAMLAVRAPRTQLRVILAGLALSLVAYLSGAPALWPASASWDQVLLGVFAAAVAAVVEEIVFRGTIQATLQRVAGSAGILAASALFASTYLDAGSATLVLTVTLAGLIFAYGTARSGSLSGALGGHVLLALGAGAIWPAVLGREHPSWLSHPVATVGLVAASAGMTLLLIRPTRIRQQSAVLAVSGLLVAAELGLIVSRATGGHPSPAALDKHVSVGLVRVAFPSAWRRQPPPAKFRLALRDELAIAPASPAGAVLVIGRTNKDDRHLLPQSLLAAFPGASTPQIVALGAVRFYRYLNPARRGKDTSESVYALPTTSGTIIGVCMTPRADPGFTSTCERVFGAIRLASGSVLPLGPNVSYGHTLNQVIAKLNAIRLSAGSQLHSAHNAQAHVKAANDLASAHAEAASALLRANAGPASAANSAVAVALQMTARAYSALARAAAHNDARGYARARASLARATDALNSGFEQLGRFGYRVT